jgi:ketosteroid isomerase-like protein
MPASLELVKIALQAYGSGDSEIAVALAGPQVRWDERASRPDGDLVWGHDNVQRAMRRYLDAWEEYRFELEDLAEVGPGKVVGICRERGKPKDGPAVDRRFGGLWVVEAGKITSWATYLTPREAVRAAKELLRADGEHPQAKPAPEARPAPEVRPEMRAEPEPRPEPERVGVAEPVEVSGQADSETPAVFDFEAAEPVVAAEPAAATEPPAGPPAERPRKRALTKSEEQKRAARARAKLRKSASRQSA